MDFVRSVGNAILDRTPEEIIGALVIASAVAIVAMGLYTLYQRKAPPPPAFVGGLALAAGLACMALAAGHIEYAENGLKHQSKASTPAPFEWPWLNPDGSVRSSPWGRVGGPWSSGFHAVLAFDRDHDGRLTPEEAAQMVREADEDGDESVDFRDVDRMLATRFGAYVPPRGSDAPDGVDRARDDQSPTGETEEDQRIPPDEQVSGKSVE